MKKVILHVGMHKTGTTAIQSAYNGYNDGETVLANLGFENHSIPLYTIYSGREHDYQVWKLQRLTADQIRQQKTDSLLRLKKAVSDTTAKRILFSGEDLSSLPKKGVEDLAAFFKDHDCNVSVIGYARSPISYIASGFQEHIKSGQNLANPPPAQYRIRFEKFIHVFGRENVEIRDFSRSSLVGGDIISDFAFATDTNTPPKGPKNNESMSTEAMRIIYMLNQLVDTVHDHPILVAAKRGAVKLAMKQFDGKAEIPHEIISPLVDAGDVRWLAETFGIDFTEEISTTNQKFDPKSLQKYLSAVEIGSLKRLSAILKRRNVATDLPMVPHVLITRLLMSFLALSPKYIRRP